MKLVELQSKFQTGILRDDQIVLASSAVSRPIERPIMILLPIDFDMEFFAAQTSKVTTASIAQGRIASHGKDRRRLSGTVTLATLRYRPRSAGVEPSATVSWSPVLTVVSREGNIGSTTRKDAIMRREIVEKIKMSGEQALFQNFPGVAAEREYPSLFDGVVAVEREHMWRIRNAAPVNHGLSIVLAGGLEPVDLEQSVPRRIEARRADFLFDLGIGDLQRPARDEAWVAKTKGFREGEEIAPIEGASEALAIHHRVFAGGFIKAPVGVNVGEIKFSAGFQQVEDALEHRRFVDRKIDDAIRNDDVEARRLQAERVEFFDIPL